MDNDAVAIIELQIALLVRRVTAITSDRKYGNLDRSAYLLLHHLSMNGAAGVKTLAGQFQLDISTASRQVSALETKGYVYKIPDSQDRRAYSLDLTELGARELQVYKQARYERVMEIVQDWSDEEREVFGRLLKKFNESL
ncbi:MarR family winged helix-turn-helix transcriptional regulator [Paenibacillus sp. GCM10023252]|uniref:MarR family winged helix-turn-helix transcriptional regulator n=1 Tax=Paenibacillus sp. GCM10023252 TaxID=3252649 RepID=UPI0036179320